MGNEKNLLIFDCDGTLIESEYANNSLISGAIQALGYQEYGVTTCIKKFRGKSLVDIVDILSKETGDYIDHNQLLNGIKLQSENANHHVKAVDNVESVLSKIKIKKCIASNGDRVSIAKYLKQVNIYSFFGDENIFTGDQVDKPKPAPDLFLYAAETLKSYPKDTVVIEDSVVGITAARAAKMKVIGFVGSSTDQEGSAKVLQSAGADYVMRDLKELFSIMTVLNIEI